MGQYSVLARMKKSFFLSATAEAELQLRSCCWFMCRHVPSSTHLTLTINEHHDYTKDVIMLSFIVENLFTDRNQIKVCLLDGEDNGYVHAPLIPVKLVRLLYEVC